MGVLRTVQTKHVQYKPLIRPEDRPPIDLNRDRMERYRPLMKPYYFDPSRYKTYLEQLGIAYPTVRTTSSAEAPSGGAR